MRVSHAIAFIVVILGVRCVDAAERPDIVVVLADDHGYWDSTVYGATDVHTPNMERLAKDGLTFTHAFVASPSCAPCRAAMLTGLMPVRNGAQANHTYAHENIASLPPLLKQQGYDTAAFGKVAHGNKDVTRHGFDVTDGRYDAAVVAKYLKGRKSTQPVCLFVGTKEPHRPWPDLDGYDPAQVNIPVKHIDTQETRDFRARYYADVTKADTLLGEIYDLAHRELGEDTLIIYSSDHGAQWPFAKWNLYDAGIRVPMIAAWPGKITPGSTTDAMVSWIDLLPTLIDITGGQAPSDIDGRSFAAVLLGQSNKHRDRIFTTQTGDGRMNVYPIRSVRTQNWKYIRNLHPEFAFTSHVDQAIDGDGLTYFMPWVNKAETDAEAAATIDRYHRRPAEELYDLQADPLEQHNLADDPSHAQRLAQMRQEVDQWMADNHDASAVLEQPRYLANPDDWKPGVMIDAKKSKKKKATAGGD